MQKIKPSVKLHVQPTSPAPMGTKSLNISTTTVDGQMALVLSAALVDMITKFPICYILIGKYLKFLWQFTLQ